MNARKTIAPFTFAMLAVAALSACDPNGIIIPKEPGRCDVGKDVYCQPAPAAKPDPGDLGG